MRKILACFVFSTLVIQSSFAGTKGVLQLKAVVASTLNVKVRGEQVNDSKSRILFKTKSNQQYSNKIELQGHQQIGLKTKLKELAGSLGKKDYEILIDHLKSEQRIYDPVYIKISAN